MGFNKTNRHCIARTIARTIAIGICISVAGTDAFGTTDTFDPFRSVESEQPFDPLVALYAVELAAASYCPFNQLTGWNCTHCADTVRDTQIIGGDTQVIMGTDPSIDSSVVSFRGSSDVANWISNFEFEKISPYENRAIKVHAGLYREYLTYHDEIFTFLENPANRRTNVLVTGHSSGAALAMFLAYDLMLSAEWNVSVYTFGKPRIGNDVFANSIYGITHHRITHGNDIVPHLPEKILGFVHTSNEVWYPDDTRIGFTICAGPEDSQCSDSCAPLSCTSIDDHLLYLGVMIGGAGCGSE